MKIIPTLLVFLLISCFLKTESATIKWTAASGSNLWTAARNWDCVCIPSINDDVIIDIPNINGSVTIPAEGATCRSLTIGGTSSTTQSLLIQGPLTIGVGGGSIKSNGLASLISSDTFPLTCNGNFYANDKFTFYSGSITGSGAFYFTDLPLQGPALKNFDISTFVTGTLSVNPGDGATTVITVTTKFLNVSGTMKSANNLIVTSEKNGKFIVSGVFENNGNNFNVAGDTVFSRLNINSGSVTFLDNVNATTVTVASGAAFDLVSENIRRISSVTGAGIMVIQGGQNTILNANIVNAKLVSGNLFSAPNSKLIFSTFEMYGGQLQTTVSSVTAHLSNAVLTSANLITQNLELDSFTSLKNAILNVTSLVTIVKESQITLENSIVNIANSASVAQNFPLKFLPSGTAPSVLENNGKWTLTSSLSVNINTRGIGSWSLGPGALLEITGISFSASLLSLTSAHFHSASANATFTSVDGKNGNITLEGQNFKAGNLNVANYYHKFGTTVFATGAISSLVFLDGYFNVTSSAKIDALYMAGGNLGGGTNMRRSILTITNSTFTSAAPKNLNDLQFFSRNIEVTCEVAELCQIFTHNTFISTKVPNYYHKQ